MPDFKDSPTKRVAFALLLVGGMFGPLVTVVIMLRFFLTRTPETTPADWAAVVRLVIILSSVSFIVALGGLLAYLVGMSRLRKIK